MAGLAWTGTGGESRFIEATIMQGNSRLILIGSLGDGMKESAEAPLSYIYSNITCLIFLNIAVQTRTEINFPC